MANKKISELTAASIPIDGDDELLEIVQGGENRNISPNNLKGGIEFNRVWDDSIDFNKSEIYYATHIMDSDITYQIGSDNLVNSSSAARQTIIADGIHAINFGSGFTFLYGITNGQILDAGTYEIYFLYTNGSVSVNVPGVSAQSSSAVVLASPSSFAGVADGENAIDLSWDNVTNNSGYQVEYSTTGTGGWNVLEVTAADAISSTHSGLAPGDVVYYRIKTLGDGTDFLDSAYSIVISGQTESGGDVTAPTFTFSPAAAATDWAVNKPITITANEPIRNTNGTDITDANVAAVITLKQTNSGGTNIPFTATIDGTKQIITITPSPQYGPTQLVYVAINNVEDVNGNEVTVAVSSTFTTNAYTDFNGISNRLQFGDILDSLWAANDTNFWLECTVKDIPLTGVRTLWAKSSLTDNQRSWYWYLNGTDVYFGWYRVVTGAPRLVKWTGVMAGNEDAILVLKYDGSIDTNDGLDRCTLLINGVTAGSKSLAASESSLGAIANSAAPLSFGVPLDSGSVPVGTTFYLKEVKDIIVRSNNGATVEINIPNVITGVDTSGNSRNGTWV